LDQLREELRELERLVKLAQQTINIGTETKLKALKECLSRAEFDELKDGRGKLLILLNIGTPGISQAESHCMGYSTCEIHGGMSALAQAAQKRFQFTSRFVWLRQPEKG